MGEYMKDLNFALNSNKNRFWHAAYTLFFGETLEEFNETVTSPSRRRKGVSRVVKFNGKEHMVLERLVRGSWNGVLLEFLSNDKLGQPGWMEMNMVSDFLAFGEVSTGVVHLMHWDELQRVWKAKRDIWKRSCRLVEARNEGYNTHSIVVPVKVLRKELGFFRTVQLYGKQDKALF